MFLYSKNYSINHNENNDEHEKTDYIDRTEIDLGLDMDTNTVNTRSVVSQYMMCVCIKQHLSNISNSIHKKVKQHWGWV